MKAHSEGVTHCAWVSSLENCYNLHALSWWNRRSPALGITRSSRPWNVAKSDFCLIFLESKSPEIRCNEESMSNSTYHPSCVVWVCPGGCTYGYNIREGCVTDDLDTILLSPSKFGGGWWQTVQCDLWWKRKSSTSYWSNELHTKRIFGVEFEAGWISHLQVCLLGSDSA